MPFSRVSFFVPSPEMVATIPASVHDHWTWIRHAVQRTPAILPDSQGPCRWFGPYNWTIQTFLYLRAAGLAPCLTATLPEQGIIIAHSDFLPIRLKPSARQFVVEIKPDRALHCTYANFAIVQNPRDPIRSGVRRALISSAAVSYWPQPGLIPRRPDRGDRFENICFMSDADQFIPGAETLQAQLARRGLRWTMMPRDRWHDYSEADAIVAVRTPTPRGRDASAFSPTRKPASKLCNAWLAGVPAILSPDVAFRDLRRSPLDYLEAQTIPEVLEQIDRLREDIDLRRAMTENAAVRAPECSPGRAVEEWKRIIEQEIRPQFADWSRSSTRRQWLYLSRRVAHEVSILVERLRAANAD